MTDDKDDNFILDLYWARNEQAIRETDIKYGKYCKTIARNILNDRCDEEETVNDTYLQTWDSVPPNRPACLSAYLGKIVRNLSINKYRARHAQKRVAGEYALSLEELSDCLPARAEDLAEKEALTQCLNEFLSAQKKEQRMVFVCRYFYCDPVADIAKRFSMSESKVKSILFRLRNKLKDYMEVFYEE
jgi:RNA polymerase sigma-70 factor (ECF subfamily)